MTKCSRCQAETEMFVNGVPMCIGCANEIESATHLSADADTVGPVECRTSLTL